MVPSRPKTLDDCSQLCDAGRGCGVAEAHHVSCGKRNHWLTCVVRPKRAVPHLVEKYQARLKVPAAEERPGGTILSDGNPPFGQLSEVRHRAGMKLLRINSLGS